MLDPPPPLRSLPDLVVLCCACSTIFDFNGDSYLKQKQNKRLLLKQLIELFTKKDLLTVVTLVKEPGSEVAGLAIVYDMVCSNILRTPKVQVTSSGANVVESVDPVADEEQIMLEVSWPHLNLVYEVLLRLLIHIPPRSMRQLISEKLIAHLFQLVKSPDPRERDYVKTILHRIYFQFS